MWLIKCQVGLTMVLVKNESYSFGLNNGYDGCGGHSSSGLEKNSFGFSMEYFDTVICF